MSTTNVNRSFHSPYPIPHPPTRHWEFEYERVPIAIEKGGEYKITLFSPAIMQEQWLHAEFVEFAGVQL